MKRMETLVRRMKWLTLLWMKKMSMELLPSTFCVCFFNTEVFCCFTKKLIELSGSIVGEGGGQRKEGIGGRLEFPHQLCRKLMKYSVMLMNSCSSVSKV